MAKIYLTAKPSCVTIIAKVGRFEKYCYYNLNRHHNLVEISYHKALLPGKGILRFGLKLRIGNCAKSM